MFWTVVSMIADASALVTAVVGVAAAVTRARHRRRGGPEDQPGNADHSDR